MTDGFSETNQRSVSTEWTDYVEKLLSNFQKGKLNKKQFIDFIEKNIQKAKQIRKEKDNLRRPSDLSDDIASADELMTEGLIEIEQGLNKLIIYASSKNDSELIFAMDDFYKGNEKIVKTIELTK